MARRSQDLQRWLIIGLSGPIIALNVWLLSQLFAYFDHLVAVLTISAILAFLLDYPVRAFQQVRIKRQGAIVIVILITIALVAILATTLMPILLAQTAQLLEKIPGWLETSRLNLDAWDNWAKERNYPIDLKGFGGRLSTQIENQIQIIAPQALGLALGTVTGLVDTILVIVLAFYMLLYGAQLWHGLLNLVPPKFAVPFGESLRTNFHNFFLSQILLALFMALAVIPVFTALKVPFTLVFALIIGVAEIIPFIGATLGIGLVTLLVALQNGWLAFQVALATIVLQQFRDNLLAPKIMGDFTGLNPLWIFIALLIGLQVAGVLGIIVAVPIAGTIKGTIDAIRHANAPIVAPPEKELPPLD
ncbi:MAG: AI-2E family transporter [Plectolyngbya sp. WJT66-NPBG17]|jgi:predicted PurR-regulated permease PerM|nr:AI-2E family transporter [Plectolyngbya sp. WJT66-NPBG17]MBW4525628.1 AI-2E family transporter [Phormidium tanganyikae FI6-MK23]